MTLASWQFRFAILVFVLAVCSWSFLMRDASGGDQGAGNNDMIPAEKREGYPPPPPPHRGRSPFADIKPEEVPSALGMSGLVCDWFDYPLTKGEDAFRPIYLPFDYTATVASPDPNESYTFPHLLSMKADWIPDNTCTRHPFFVFQREPDRLPDLRKPSPALLAAFTNSWTATHAVGGSLRETPNGCSGSLVVYDRQGQSVFSREYDEPRDYFQLMADMTADLFAFRKCPLSAELRAELERKCTSSDEALRAFGAAATVRPRSHDEWSCYEKALALDPDFAEARFWYGNQKGWDTGDDKLGFQLRGQALKSHLVFRAVAECTSVQLDEETARVIADARQKALKLAPENPEILLAAALQKTSFHLEKLPDDELARLVDAVRRCPSSGDVLYRLAKAYFLKGMPEKAIPLALSETASGYLWPTSGHMSSWNCAGRAFLYGCADWKRAFTCAARALGEAEYEKEDIAVSLTLEAVDLRELCRFRQASAMLQKAYELQPDPWRLIWWIECLYEGGSPDEAIEVQDKYKEAIEKNSRLKYMTAAAQEIFYGQDINSGLWRILKNAPNEPDGMTRDDEMLAQVATYVENAESWRSRPYSGAFYNPWERREWILLDLWERRKRTEVSDYLYEAYTWLHPDDAYFAGARDEFVRTRTAPAPQVDTARVLGILNKAAGMSQADGYAYAGENLKPMLVEWHLKRLLEARDFEAAEQLATAYETSARIWSSSEFFHCWTHLLHRRVSLARQQAGSTAAGTPARPEMPR